MKIIIKYHAQKRMIERIFSLEEVKEAVRDGQYIFNGVISKSQKSYDVIHNGLRVCVIEDSRKNSVIVKTVYTTKYLNNKLHEEKNRTNKPIYKIMESSKNITRKEIKKDVYKNTKTKSKRKKIKAFRNPDLIVCC